MMVRKILFMKKYLWRIDLSNIIFSRLKVLMMMDSMKFVTMVALLPPVQGLVQTKVQRLENV